MKIILSKLPDYLAFGRHLARKDYINAAKALDSCIAIATQANDLELVAFLFQSQGTVAHHLGNDEQAIKYYKKVESLGLSNDELLFYRLFFAKFLLMKVSDYPQALELCEDFIKNFTHNARPNDKNLDEDVDFLADAYCVRGHCHLELSHVEKAVDDFRNFLNLGNVSIIGHAGEFCRALIRRKLCVQEAAAYLSRVGMKWNET